MKKRSHSAAQASLRLIAILSLSLPKFRTSRCYPPNQDSSSAVSVPVGNTSTLKFGEIYFSIVLKIGISLT